MEGGDRVHRLVGRSSEARSILIWSFLVVGLVGFAGYID